MMSTLKEANQKIKNDIYKNTPIIQFDEYPNFNGLNNFIYQDLAVTYLRELYDKNHKVFDLSGFGHIPYTSILKRENYQYDFYKNCKGIFTMGEWLSIYLKEKYPEFERKIHHIGGGVNIDSSKIDHTVKEGNKILFVGKDFERKGGHLVVRAFDYLYEHLDNSVELYIIGPKSQSYKSNNPNIHFIGEVPIENLSYYFNICDIFCMPSYFEAYGLVFIEALTFGLPCIGRRCFEMEHFIEDGVTGYLIENDDVKILANKMSTLLQNKTIKNNVVNNFDRYILDYSWDTVTDKIIKIIENS